MTVHRQGLQREAELFQRCIRPTVTLRRLRDQEHAALGEEACTTLGDDGRRAEGTRHHCRTHTPKVRVPGRVFRGGRHDVDTVVDAERCDCRPKKGRAAGLAVEQHRRPFRAQ